jgi:CRP-like cAMP-binding protein
MVEILLSYFQNKISLSESDISIIKSSFILKKLGKREILLREGEVAKDGNFVASGCLRSYAIDEKGKQHIIQFAPENWWLTNAESIMSGSPSAYFIDALEESFIFTIEFKSFEGILKSIPALGFMFQQGIQKHASAKDKRIIAALASTAEERYQDFLTTYPAIAQRVPQHMLASYLGISPETLSRIRKQMTRKK